MSDFDVHCRNENNQMFTTGVFSFYSDTDPFQSMTPAQLKKYLGGRFDAISITKDHAELQYENSQINIRYWFRSSNDQKNLYVIGRDYSASHINYVFYEMNAR